MKINSAIQPTVFLVDDDRAARDSMAFLLRSQGFKVTEFWSGKRLLEHIDQTEYGCLILDIEMPGIDGTELQQILDRQGIRIPIIFISGHADVPIATQVLRAGAIDLLEKPIEAGRLTSRIRDAFETSRQICGEEASRRLLHQRLERLTNKEREVLPAIYFGHSLKQIGSQFQVTLATASRHQARIFQKLEIDSAAQLIHLVEAAKFDISVLEQAS